jgi:integrase
MTPLAAAADKYLKMRRALGFKLRHQTWWLPDFVAFVRGQGSSTITVDLAVRWAQQPADAHPNWWARRLSAIRCFAKYYQAYDPRTQVPPPDLLPSRRVRQLPHIYSNDEIHSLLAKARQIRDGFLSVTYTTLLGLLAATGMRVGEALALDEEDIDLRRSLITVRNGKFGKSRLVPLHPSAVVALQHYARLRDRWGPRRRTRSFFLSTSGTRVYHQNFHHVFLRLVRLAGIRGQGGRRPRLHDLRHTFAVKTLREWYRAGIDVEPRLAALSTYLGHVNPTSTYWYLTATPDLLSLAADRLEHSWKVQP